MNDNYLHKKDKLYYARILPQVDIYEVCEITIRTVEEEWFVGIDKVTKHAFLFNRKDLDNKVFTDRQQALNKVKDAEKQQRSN